MAKKVELFDKFLEDNKITCFSKETLDNEYHTTVYRAHMEVAKQDLPTMVVIDDSIYSMVQVLVSQGTVTAENQAAVEHYLNDLNKRFKVFKYYVGDGNNICLDACVSSTDTGFEPTILHAVIDVILKHLTEEYPKLMGKVWGN